MTYRVYRVQRSSKEPLLRYIITALEASGCSIVRVSIPTEAPFRVTFETPWGERIGIVAYAFLANSTLTRNRPSDEHRFQVKYSTNDRGLHDLWQDPYGLYVTVFLGIDVAKGFFVAADPVLNSPTRFFISKEFKQDHAIEILRRGWLSWERERSSRLADPIEVMVGGTASHFLRYVLFEREARGEDQGHRQLIAERFGRVEIGAKAQVASAGDELPLLSRARLHSLETEFELSTEEILDLIASAPRLRMAVRGWVAERHLLHALEQLPDVAECETIAGDGQPDIRFAFTGGRPLLIECKNVLRASDRYGRPRMDFMRTRASISDRCSRYYSPADFDVVAACLHAHTESWDFRLRPTRKMDVHPNCQGKLNHRVIVDEAWTGDLLGGLRSATAS